MNYNRIRNQVRRLTRKAKVLLERSMAKNANSNQKHFWRDTQSKLKTKAGIPDLVKSDGKDRNPQSTQTFTKNDKDKADVFVSYFSSVFTEEPKNDTMPHFEGRDFETKLSSIEINEDLVLKKLKKLKVNKSPGPDQMHPRVLKEISLSIVKPVTMIFRTSLRTSTVPIK